MSETLPVVDVSAEPAALADAIGRAARGIGFFYVRGHGIDPALIASTFLGSERFFALPAEEKEGQSIKHSPDNRGYVGMEGESPQPTKPAELKEGFKLWVD